MHPNSQAGNGYGDIVQMLLSKGAAAAVEDNCKRTPLLRACASKSRSQGGGSSVAAEVNPAFAVEVLLRAGCDVEQVDIDGSTPLIAAASAGSDDVCQVLLGR